MRFVLCVPYRELCVITHRTDLQGSCDIGAEGDNIGCIFPFDIGDSRLPTQLGNPLCAKRTHQTFRLSVKEQKFKP